MKYFLLIILAIILSDSTSLTKIWLQENLGNGIMIDSVTAISTYNECFIITRKKQTYGFYPMHHWTIEKIEGSSK
jgi:hypothetical protein